MSYSSKNTQSRGINFHDYGNVSNLWVEVTSDSTALFNSIEILYNCNPKSLTGVSIESEPIKTVYAVGETFDPDGMVVKANYSNATKVATENYSISPNRPLTLSDTKVTVSFMGFTADQNITVVEKYATSLTVTGGTRQYEIGDTFVFDGSAEVTYSDSSTKDVTSSVVVASSPNMNMLGYQDATISYTEDGITVSAAFTIHIVEPAGIAHIFYGTFDFDNFEFIEGVEGLDLENSVLPATATPDSTVTVTIVCEEGYTFSSIWAFNDDSDVIYDSLNIDGNVVTFTMPSYTAYLVVELSNSVTPSGLVLEGTYTITNASSSAVVASLVFNSDGTGTYNYKYGAAGTQRAVNFTYSGTEEQLTFTLVSYASGSSNSDFGSYRMFDSGNTNSTGSVSGNVVTVTLCASGNYNPTPRTFEK